MGKKKQSASAFVDGIVKMLESDTKSRGIAPMVQSVLVKVSDSAKRERTAKVMSSTQLSEEEKTHIAELVERLKGDEDFDIEYTVDRALIAGLKIYVSDIILDTTYQTQLEQMAHFLAE